MEKLVSLRWEMTSTGSKNLKEIQKSWAKCESVNKEFADVYLEARIFLPENIDRLRHELLRMSARGYFIGQDIRGGKYDPEEAISWSKDSREIEEAIIKRIQEYIGL
jgi:hypothetical protein